MPQKFAPIIRETKRDSYTQKVIVVATLNGVSKDTTVEPSDKEYTSQ